LRQNPVDPALRRFCHDRPADLMADAATWPDDVKYTEKTAAWHFIDIPLTVSERTSLTPWCPPIGPPSIGPSVAGKDRPGCIVNALEYELSILRDKTRSGPDRASALRYVIHFAGDIHQPLHDSDNNDEGGNCTALRFFAEGRPAKLHAIWDYMLIQRELSNRHATEAGYAQELDKRFADRSSGWILALNPVDWAWEGHQLAVTIAYGDLKPAIPFETPGPHDCPLETGKVAALHIAVGERYFDETVPVIDEQLAKAGYRLAALLNRIW
jgi:hypothetical protein